MNRKIKIHIIDTSNESKKSKLEPLQSVIEVGDSPDGTAECVLKNQLGEFDIKKLSQQTVVQEGECEIIIYEYVL